MSGEGRSARDPNRLTPPSFELPDNMDDYELWTVRLPSSVNVESLQGVELDMSRSASLGTFQADDADYTLSRGAAFENEQFRLLLRDDNFLRAHERPFDGHVNVNAAIGDMVDTELAPRLETAPTPADTIRRSYSHVPQVSGLKRRWMPPGGGSVPPAARGEKSKEKGTSDGTLNGVIGDGEGVGSAPSTPKARKRKSGGQHSSSATGSSKIRAASSADGDDTPASKRGKHEETHVNGDHFSSKNKSKKERKKEKKANKEKKRASKEHRIKSEK